MNDKSIWGQPSVSGYPPDQFIWVFVPLCGCATSCFEDGGSFSSVRRIVLGQTCNVEVPAHNDVDVVFDKKMIKDITRPLCDLQRPWKPRPWCYSGSVRLRVGRCQRMMHD